MTLSTLQHLRSFAGGEHPLNLEPGQIAFNMATSNNHNMYMYVGNSSNQRVDEDGTVLIAGGDPNKGWIRYNLLNAITVDSSGNAIVRSDLVLTPSNAQTPSANGDLVIEATDDTTLTFKLKGSDGTVRSGTIALN